MSSPSILIHFSSLDDPRVERTRRHPLVDIIVISILSTISGGEGWEDMEEFGEYHENWLRTFLDLPSGIPSADTFRRVFNALDPKKFQECFSAWMHALAEGTRGKLIAIDGKTVRRSFSKEHGIKPVHIVNAWVVENQLVLAQVATDEKSNEITAIPERLKLLQLKEATVSLDAMGCQKKIAEDITNRGGNYVMGLKGNQGHLKDSVEFFFKAALKDDFKDIEFSEFQETEKGHGRIERRTVWSTNDIDWFTEKSLWANLRSITMVKRERTIGESSSEEFSYYISSHDPDAALLGSRIREHWSIENSLHWRLDMTFGEDLSRVRNRNGAINLSALRKLALGLLKREPTMAKKSVRKKRWRAGMDLSYLLKVLSAAEIPKTQAK